MPRPELAEICADADVVDEKTIESQATMREFVARTLSWHPPWMRFLFAVRVLLALALRLRTAVPPRTGPLRPEDVSFTPGDRMAFFTVESGVADESLVLVIDDVHLKGRLAFLASASPAGRRFDVVTVVHFHRRSGTFYWKVIRPFHHVVVRSMMRAGAAA